MTDTSREAVGLLVEMLLQTDKNKQGYYGYVPFNRDGASAAATLRALQVKLDVATEALVIAEDALARQSWQWTGVGPHPQEVIETVRTALASIKEPT